MTTPQITQYQAGHHHIYIEEIDDYSPFLVVFAPMDRLIAKTNTLWGIEFIKKSTFKCNLIAIGAIDKETWYRCPILHNALKDIGECLKHRTVIGYGWCMGGYAVSAFSDILHMNTMLLVNPISTLNDDLAPFETTPSYQKYKRLDWHGEFFDGADNNTPGYLIYDRLSQKDRQHANRYPHVKKLNFTGCGHDIVPLIQADMIRFSLASLIKHGQINEHAFHRKARNRRKIQACYIHLLTYATQKNKTKAIEIIEKHRQYLNDPTAIWGHLDGVENNHISGWCTHKDLPNTSLNITIEIDSEIVHTMTANSYRQDLKDNNIGNGFHGFHWEIPLTFQDKKQHMVVIYVETKNQRIPLTGSPKWF